MDLGLRNKVVLVAASSQGLGKAVAIEMAKEGANVAICGRDTKRLEAAKLEIDAHGSGEVFSVAGDLSNVTDRASILNKVLKCFGKVDVLVTNTGGPPSGKFEDLSEDDWNNSYQLLLGSAVALIKGVIPGMKAQGWGRIITITSISVKQPVENLILSNSVRASVVGLMKSLASELGDYNITVNNIMPGYTQTNRLLSLIETNPSINSVTDEIPLKRFGTPEEFAAAVTFMASERASYITGTSLAVDGGWIKNIL